jgi:hypothetical protein
MSFIWKCFGEAGCFPGSDGKSVPGGEGGTGREARFDEQASDVERAVAGKKPLILERSRRA